MPNTIRSQRATPEDASKEACAVPPLSADFLETLPADLTLLTASSRRDALVRLAGYSILDFLRVADDLKLSSEAAASILLDPSVRKKHRRFFEVLGQKAAKLIRCEPQVESERKTLEELANGNAGTSAQIADNFFTPHIDPACGKILSALDTYYAPVVGMRQVVDAESVKVNPVDALEGWLCLNQPRNSNVDEQFDWLMEKYERAFDKHQWLGVWREKIEVAFGGEAKTLEALSEVEQKVFYAKETISEEMLRSIATRSGIDMDAPEQFRLLKEHRYTALEVVTNLEKSEVFEHLAERLATSLRERGVPAGSLRLERENGLIVLKCNGTDRTLREEPEAHVTVLDKVSLDLKSAELTWTKVSQDRIAYCIQDEAANTSIIALGDGKQHAFDAQVTRKPVLENGKVYTIGRKCVDNEFVYSIVSVDGVQPIPVAGEVKLFGFLGGVPFIHVDSPNDTSVFWMGGQVVREEVGTIKELIINGDQLAYIIRDGSYPKAYSYQVVEGTWRSPRFKNASDLTIVGGKLAFWAETESGAVVYFNRCASELFQSGSSKHYEINAVGKKPVFVATTLDGIHGVYHGRDRIATLPDVQGTYTLAVGNEVASVIHVNKPEGVEDTVVFRGECYVFKSDDTSPYSRAVNVDVVGQELVLAYRRDSSAREKGHGPNTVIVTHGESRWEHEAESVVLLPYQEKVNYIIGDSSGEEASIRFVCEGDVSEPYAHIGYRAEVGGVPAFVARKHNGQWIVRHGAKEYNAAGESFPLPHPERGLAYATQQGSDVTISVEGRIVEIFRGRTLVRFRTIRDDKPGTFILELKHPESDIFELVALRVTPTDAPEWGERLSESERELLCKINVVVSPTAETVKAYRAAHRAQELELQAEPTLSEMLSRGISRSRGAIGTINDLIQASPELFLDVFRAKTTLTSSDHVNAVLYRIAPIACAASGYRDRPIHYVRTSSPLTSSQDRQKREIRSDPKYKSDKDLISTSLKGPSFMTRHMLAAYSKDGWQMLKVPPGRTHSLETHVVRCVAHVIPSQRGKFGAEWSSYLERERVPLAQRILKSMWFWCKRRFTELAGPDGHGEAGEIELPRVLNSTYIPSQVFIHDVLGQESAVTTSLGVDGCAYARFPRGAKYVSYSLAVPSSDALKKAVVPLSQDDYERCLMRDCPEVVEQINQPLGGLNESCRRFLREIQDDPPMVRISKILDFIHARAHYDWDNEELGAVGTSCSPAESFELMEARALHLKRDGRAPRNKDFAGVCEDFSVLCVAMMRESGMPAAILKGMATDSTGGALEGSEHSKVCVPWPLVGRRGEYIFLEFEPTTGDGSSETGTPAAGDARHPGRDANKENEPADSAKSDAPLSTALDSVVSILSAIRREDKQPTVEALSADEIRSKVNREPEQTVNELLAMMTPESTANVRELLDLAFYGGVNSSNDEFVGHAKNLRDRLKSPLFRSAAPRQDFFEMLLSYVEAHTRHRKDNQPLPDLRRAAIAELESIIERGRGALSQSEFATAIAALSYLRSNKMSPR